MQPVITGDELKQRRMAAGLDQRALADMLGVRPQSVSQWETGKTKPSWQQARKLEEIFGVPETTRLQRLENEMQELREALKRILPPDDPLAGSPDPSGPEPPD